MNKFSEEEIEEFDEDYELNIEEQKLQEIEQEESIKVKNGKVEFKYVNHSERAAELGRISDGDTTKYVNVALEYFENRCALSGEEFVNFGKVEKYSAKSNLSAEHVVALCLDGDDIVPNIVPTVLQYNLKKNGYYILDYWEKQKDINGKTLYSPYRLLKLVNFMMKSIEARGLDVRKYKKAILTPNEIDEYLKQIEEQDKKETDNNKKKIYSDTITATTIDEDNKKLLTEVPSIEGNIPTQKEQQEKQEKTRNNEEIKIRMMDIFLIDAIREIKESQELGQVVLQDKDGKEILLTEKLDQMLEKTIGKIPFEVQVRNKILQSLERYGIEENKYSVANDLLKNTDILRYAQNEEIQEEQIEEYIDTILEKKVNELKEILTEEQIQIAITNNPQIIYDNSYIERIKFWKENRETSLEELLQEYTSTDELVDVIIVLKKEGIDLSNVKYASKLHDLISNKESLEIIIKRLQIILKDIDKNWMFGKRLDKQKNANKFNAFIEEIEKLDLNLTDEEKKIILEKESNQQRSQRKTKEFVQVLKILKEEEINLSNIKNISKLGDLINKKENAEDIIKRLQLISKDIDENWNIGYRLNNQKIKNNYKQFINEIKKVGLNLTEEERKVIIDKKEKQYKKITIEEFVQILIVLKDVKIDLSLIKKETKLKDLIQENNLEEILDKIQRISEEIDENWPVGFKLNYQKNGNTYKKFIEEIEKVGLDLTDEEKKIILEKESNQQRSQRKTKEFVQVLKILKEEEIDLSNIKNISKLGDLINKKENAEEIIKKLQQISKDIDKNWNIGQRLNAQKSNNRIEKFIEEIEKVGVDLTDEEKKIILEKENNQEKSQRKTKEFIQVLKILKEEEIDLSNIKQNYSFKLFELLEKKDNSKEIIKRLQEISGEIDENWSIGVKLSIQKSKENLKKFKEEIKKSGLDSLLSEDEIKKLTEVETTQEKGRRMTKEFVQALKILKEEGIDLSNIIKACKVEDLLQKKENAKEIILKLQEVSEEIDDNWPIGIRLQKQKSKKNIEKFKEEIRMSGLDLLLTDAERKKLTEVQFKKTNFKEIQEATQYVSTEKCDEKQIYLKQLERQIEEQEKAV